MSPATGTWIIVAAVLASSMAFIDSTALNVALPTIQNQLKASGFDLLWIVNAYNLPVSALILLGGSLGDRYGLKKVFSLGIGAFLISSVLCGLAPSSKFLILARFFQGVGGAMMIPGSLALITRLFPEKESGKAIGTWSAFATLTTIGGPILGGVLSEYGLWRVIFFINIPIGILALWVLAFKVPKVPVVTEKTSLDIPGAILITGALTIITAGFLESSPSVGLNVHQVMAIAIGFFLLLVFGWWEQKTKTPMLPFSIFKNRVFTGANLLTVALYSSLYGVMFFIPLNLIQIQNYPATYAGMALLPSTILLTVLSRYAGKIADKHGPRGLLTAGPILVGFSYLTFTFAGHTAGPQDYWWTFFPPSILFGIGMGLTVAPLTATVMAAAPKSMSGLASGINNAAARVSGVLAVAILGAVGLFFFQTDLLESLGALSLQPTLIERIKLESVNLGGMDTSFFPGPRVLKGFIADSFILMFNKVFYIGAILSWISALFAWFLLKKPAKS